MKTKQTPAPDPQEIKRDESGKIIVEFSRDKNSLFQRIKKAVRVRQVDPDEIERFYKMDKETFQLLLGVVWNDCPIEGCTNKVCLALNSDKCFPHTKGHRQWKLLKIWWKNLFR